MPFICINNQRSLKCHKDGKVRKIISIHWDMNLHVFWHVQTYTHIERCRWCAKGNENKFRFSLNSFNYCRIIESRYKHMAIFAINYSDGCYQISLTLCMKLLSGKELEKIICICDMFSGRVKLPHKCQTEDIAIEMNRLKHTIGFMWRRILSHNIWGQNKGK